MSPVQFFYNNPYFENLKETKPFLDYLERERRKIREVIKGGRILDIGCGNGRSTQILADVCDEVIGVDYSERLLKQAKEKLPGIKFYLEDARSTHFEDASFDYVAMLWNTTGNLYPSRGLVLQEARRVLKPQGKILISVLSEGALLPYLEMVRQNRLSVLCYEKNYVFLREGLISERFSRKRLEEVCMANSLISEIERLTSISYWCEAIKKYRSAAAFFYGFFLR